MKYSTLRPVLFVIYINDLPEVVRSMVQMLADDTKVFRQMEKDSDSCHLQKDLNNMGKWSSDWQLKFNAAKYKGMHSGGKNSKHVYKIKDGMDDGPLSEIMIEKDSGVMVDNKHSANISRTRMLCADYAHHLHVHFWKMEMFCGHHSTRRMLSQSGRSKAGQQNLYMDSRKYLTNNVCIV